MNEFTLSAVWTSDLAKSAKKMMCWDKSDWKKSPCLSTAANRPDLSERQLPLILTVSTELSHTAGLLYGYSKPENYSEETGLPFGNVHEFTSIDHIIGMQIILYNFCLLEAYEFSCYQKSIQNNFDIFSDEKFSLKDFQNRGYEKLLQGVQNRELAKYERMSVEKRINSWSKIGINLEKHEESYIERYNELSQRRNELTHEAKPTQVNIKEALIFFHTARLVAKFIAEKFDDSSIELCDTPWHDMPPYTS